MFGKGTHESYSQTEAWSKSDKHRGGIEALLLCAVGLKEFYNLGVTIFRSDHQRCPAGLISGIDGSALSNEQSNHGHDRYRKQPSEVVQPLLPAFT